MTSHIRLRHIGVQTFSERKIKMVICAVKGCGTRSGSCKVGTNSKEISLFRLPKVRYNQGERDRELSERRRRQFLKNIYRSGINEKAVDNMRVCSRHFVSGKPANFRDEKNIDWAPTVALGPKYVTEEKRCDRILRSQVKKQKKRSRKKQGCKLNKQCGSEQGASSSHLDDDVDSSQQSETVVPTALVISKSGNGDERALHIFGIKQENIDDDDDDDEMQSAADNTGILNNVNIKTFGSHTEHPYPVSIIKVKHKEKDEQDNVSFEMTDSSFVKENVICSNNFYCTRPTSLLEELNGKTSKEKESLHTSIKKKTVTDIDKTVIKTEIKTEVDEEFEDILSQEPSYTETWVKNEVNDAPYESMYSVFKCA